MTPLERQVLRWVAAAAVASGALAFASGVGGAAPLRAWEAFLTNLLFWLGIAQGGIVVSAALYLTQARWGGPGIYRLAEAFAAFLPVGFILFWALVFGRTLIFPWISHPIAAKAAWLNVPFLFARDGAALLAITVLSLIFVRVSRSPEAVTWAQSPESIGMPPPPIRRLAPAVIILYAVVYSLIAFDLVMSLSPLWYSTLFGAYFFAGAFWSALAAIAIMAIILSRRTGEQRPSGREHLLHDLGKLVFAFSVFWVYLFWSQYLPIWYADIPRETFFVVLRTKAMPWRALSLAALTLIWVIPFVVLMSRRAKQTAVILGPVCALGLVGMWLERYVLIVPSLTPHSIPIGLLEALITLGFGGAFALAALPGLSLVPALQSASAQARE